MKNLTILMSWIVTLLFCSVTLAQTDRSGEAEKLQTGLKSPSRTQRINAAKIITRSGLNEPELYQTIADLLREGYPVASSPDQVDEMAWLCKALAASGDATHRPLLKEIATQSSSEKLKHYARQSNDLLDEFAERSRILNADDSWDKELTGEENRLINMLSSDNVSLRRDAAKMLVRRVMTAPKVFDSAAEALAGMTRENSSGLLQVDTMAWLSKALAASGNPKYIELLEKVKSQTYDPKLLMHVNNSLKALENI